MAGWLIEYGHLHLFSHDFQNLPIEHFIAYLDGSDVSVRIGDGGTVSCAAFDYVHRDDLLNKTSVFEFVRGYQKRLIPSTCSFLT
jgi:hypothetical protein